MAEIQQSETNRKRRGVARSKKLSTRVDLTPMVDLGFLLITFFIFTTTIAKPTAMNLVMPNDKNVVDSTRLPENKTLTFVIGKNDKLYYYKRSFKGSLTETSFGTGGIRQIIASHKQRVRDLYNTDKAVVLIKVTNYASYQNLVKCLDEMLINSISTYMLLDATNEEAYAAFTR